MSRFISPLECYFSPILPFSPNKLAYPDFKARYNIIGAAAVAKAKNDKAAGQAVMDIVKVSQRCLNSMNVQN